MQLVLLFLWLLLANLLALLVGYGVHFATRRWPGRVAFILLGTILAGLLATAYYALLADLESRYWLFIGLSLVILGGAGFGIIPKGGPLVPESPQDGEAADPPQRHPLVEVLASYVAACWLCTGVVGFVFVMAYLIASPPGSLR
jgi:hypothetical protein